MKVTFDHGKNSKGQQITNSITDVKSRVTIELDGYQEMYNQLESLIEDVQKEPEFNGGGAVDNILEIIANYKVILK